MEKIYRHFKGGYYRFVAEVTMESARLGLALPICSTER